MRKFSGIVAMGLIAASMISGGNLVDVGITVGDIENADTIWVDEYFTFDFYFENDDTLGGYSTGYTVWSDDGADWEFVEAGCDPTWYPPYMTFCCQIRYYEAVPDSRQDPVIQVLDNGGLSVVMADTDGAPRDTFLFGGTRKDHGVYPGSLEKQIRFFLVATAPDNGSVCHICIDSSKVGSAGDFLFGDVEGGAYVPEVLWPEGGRCWPVKKYSSPGDVNSDYAINIADVVYQVNYIFHDGPTPAVMVNADVNSDCSINIGDAVYLSNYIFQKGGPPQTGCRPPPDMPYETCD